MPILKTFVVGIQSLFRREQLNRELDEEMQGFVEAAAEQKMRAGMTREQAFRAARAEMGSTAAVRDQVNESGWESLLHGIGQDFRYCFRILRKNPGFTALAVITLALGMGVSTTVFGWIDAFLLHPFPGLNKPDEVVSFENLTLDGQPVTTSYLDYRDYRDHLTMLAGLAMSRHSELNVGEPESAMRVWGQFVSGNYFAVLGVKPVLGRVFTPEEYADNPGAFPLTVISYRFWHTRYNSDPHIVGKTIKVNQHELTIIGVTPPEFRGSMVGLAYDLWIPLMMRPQLSGFQTAWQLTDRKNRDLIGIARLKPDVTIGQAQSEIAALAAIMAKAQPWEDGGVSATVLPLWKSHFGPQGLMLAPLQILIGVCAVLVLIVCANVANLLLARFTTRQKEFSLRLALGARRTRLGRQLLIESLVLAGAGALLGIVMSVWLGKSLRFMMPPGEHLALDTNLSLPVLVFTALLCLATTVLCGFVPALQSVRINLNDSLKESGRTGAAAPRSHRMRTMLVLAEVSLALVALIGAGLFVRGFRALQKIDPGFDPENVLLAKFSLSTSGFNLMQRREFCFRLRERLESEPGISAVSYSDDVPLGLEPSWWEDLKIKGYQPSPGENMKIYRNVVAPGYFQLMQIPLVEGRDFTEHDDDNTAPVMIVNQSFVKRFFGPGVVLGREVYGWGQWFKVVGVARDSKYNYPTEGAIPYFYVPFRQVYRNDMYLSFYLKVHGKPEQANATLRRAVHEIDPRVTFFDSFPLSEYISVSLYPQKVTANVLSVLGLLALLLAAVGLYSVMAYSVAQRTQEIGIRMALGAQRSNVLTLVLGQAFRLTFTGLLVGGALALALARKVAQIPVSGSVMGGAGNLLGTRSMDPLVYLAAALFLSAVALLASYIPARRATKVDPLVALRYE